MTIATSAIIHGARTGSDDLGMTKRAIILSTVVAFEYVLIGFQLECMKLLNWL